MTEASLEDALRQAQLLAKRGESERARQLYRAILDREPDNKSAKEAMAALDRRSAAFQALSALYQKGDFAAVLAEAKDLALRYPDTVFLQNMLGAAHAGLGQWEDAAAFYRKGLALRPDIAEAHANLGKCLSELKRHDQAIPCFARAIGLKPDYADAHYSLGIVLTAVGRKADAVQAFSRAIAIRPDFAEAYNNLGIALNEIGRSEDAVRCYREALKRAPNAATYTNMGAALRKLDRYDESIAAFEEALKLAPDIADTRAQKLFQQAIILDWEALAEDAAAIPELGIRGSPVRPFVMLPFEDDPAHQRTRAERFAQGKFPQASIGPFASSAADTDHLRIGYFSADFHDHAVMHMIARLFERHDRARFRIHGYSYGPHAADAIRRRAAAAMDVFHDVRTFRDREIAELARKDGIDIAVDLMGHTENARTEIFAYRAAPIQIAYLGYPGTMGAPFMDYLIADRSLIPEGNERHYTENLILLPHSYMPGDEEREISATPPSRAAMGLPAEGFVFCCFNNSYKISVREFDIWMRLLREIEGSVLWLSRPNPWALRNLGMEAQKRGIDPARLVFAERLPMPEHLARHRLADLFLDTFHYNAHSTASDALWAGLPVITKPGRGFAARVGASLLTALELPELIAHSEDAYEALALALACNPERLGALKAKLWVKRKTAPLFDSRLLARHIEAAYREAHRRHRAGEKPSLLIMN